MATKIIEAFSYIIILLDGELECTEHERVNRKRWSVCIPDDICIKF